MRAPIPAETLSPFPNTETANQTHSPVSPEATTPHKYGRAIGRATVVVTATASLASLGAAAASGEGAQHNANELRAGTSSTSSHRLDNITRVAHQSQDIYTGRVTITSTRRTKIEREPSTTTQSAESDGVTVGKIMGIPAANITQGKNSEVSIGGRKIDLAKYTTTHRKAEAWTNARDGDCLWNFAAQDIGVAAIEAGQTQEQARAAMNNPKNIKRVMAGYIADNPELKANPNLVLTGKEYVAKHAREEADELVAAMQAAQSPDAKPAPPVAAKPQPDTAKAHPNTNPVHAAPKANNESGFKEMTIKATKVLAGALLAVGALVGAAAGTIGLTRRRRRRQEEALAEAEAAAGKHRSPDDPDGGEPVPTETGSLNELRRITVEDEQSGHDPFGPSTGAHAQGSDLGKSPYAPPVESARAAVPAATPDAPTDIRARFGTPKLIENVNGSGRRHLRSVPARGVNTDTVASIQRAFTARAEPSAETNIKDSPTDPSAAPVIPLNGRRPLEGGGRQPDGSYIGMHRPKSIDPISDVRIHRPGVMDDDTVAVAM